MIVKELNPGNIRLDGDTQPRAHLNRSMIEEYAESIQRGDAMPPLDVFHDGENFWLADGFHRYYAMAGLDSDRPIKCNVHKGTLDDAKWFSYGANRTHGIHRSNDDKAKTVKAALLHANGAEMSDRQIAEHVGVGSTMVLKYRHELATTAQIEQSDARTGRDGRKINTANIGKQSAKEANPAKKRTSRAKVFKPIRGHSEMAPMISLTLPVNKPEIAAAALWQEFPVSYIETLIQVFSKFIQEEKGE